MNRQKIVTDVRLAALLSHMRYQFRAVKDPIGTQFLFSDPGDIDEAIQDYENGAQVASAKDLLLMYDTFLDEMKAKPSATKITKIAESTPVVPSAGKEFYTRDAIAAAALVALGYTISRVDPPEGQWRWPRFHFADDGRAMSRSKDVSQQIKVWMDKQ